MAKVTLKRVGKSYSTDTHAVRDLDLEVRDTEFLVLVGPSGCGKSTTLRMIAGLEQVTQGEIFIGDRDVTNVAPKDRDIAMVFQNYALYPHMTVYKNIAFGLELRSGGNFLERWFRRLISPSNATQLESLWQQIPAKVQRVAETLRIKHLLERKPKQLSGGERQRVALARAIVRQPAAFLFDEPLSNLDAKLRGETRLELRRLHEQLKATMIYVTHDQIEAMTLGDRIVVMDQGVIQQVGTPTEVYNHPVNRFVAGFLGSPPMNLVPGKLIQHNSSLRFVGSGLEFPLKYLENNFNLQLQKNQHINEQTVELGFRPEDVMLYPADSNDFESDHLGSGDLRLTKEMKVQFVESLGDCDLIHFHLPIEEQNVANQAKPLICKQPRGMTERIIRSGETVVVGLRNSKIHLFDQAMGQNLSLQDETDRKS